jgi:hypothetical protein
MSLRAILEVVVHLDTFRNIDLFFQGLYYVKVSIHNKKGQEVSDIQEIFRRSIRYGRRLRIICRIDNI